MATRCYIGIRDGYYVKYIYNHYDGYPKGVGRMLRNHYNTEDAINEMIDLGDRSSLNENPNDDTYVSRGEDYESNKPRKISYMTWINRMKWRGGEQYNYLFDEGRWRCWNSEGKEIIMNDN